MVEDVVKSMQGTQQGTHKRLFQSKAMRMQRARKQQAAN